MLEVRLAAEVEAEEGVEAAKGRRVRPRVEADVPLSHDQPVAPDAHIHGMIGD